MRGNPIESELFPTPNHIHQIEVDKTFTNITQSFASQHYSVSYKLKATEQNPICGFTITYENSGNKLKEEPYFILEIRYKTTDDKTNEVYAIINHTHAYIKNKDNKQKDNIIVKKTDLNSNSYLFLFYSNETFSIPITDITTSTNNMLKLTLIEIRVYVSNIILREIKAKRTNDNDLDYHSYTLSLTQNTNHKIHSKVNNTDTRTLIIVPEPADRPFYVDLINNGFQYQTTIGYYYDNLRGNNSKIVSYNRYSIGQIHAPTINCYKNQPIMNLSMIEIKHGSLNIQDLPYPIVICDNTFIMQNCDLEYLYSNHKQNEALEHSNSHKYVSYVNTGRTNNLNGILSVRIEGNYINTHHYDPVLSPTYTGYYDPEDYENGIYRGKLCDVNLADNKMEGNRLNGIEYDEKLYLPPNATYEHKLYTIMMYFIFYNHDFDILMQNRILSHMLWDGVANVHTKIIQSG